MPDTDDSQHFDTTQDEEVAEDAASTDEDEPGERRRFLVPTSRSCAQRPRKRG